jgi:long-chain acyl-CoA synthetase
VSNRNFPRGRGAAKAPFGEMREPLFQRWRSTVERSPHAMAVADAASGRSWTRAELAAAGAELAASFARRTGTASLAGRRVALCLPNGAEWLQVFLALLSTRSVPVPIDPSEPEEAQLACARSVGAAHIWKAGGLHRLDSAGRPPRRRLPGSECLVKVTSGSSGVPKALSVTDGQLAADGRQICESMGIGPEDASLAAIPLGYSYGLGNLVAPLLLQGSPILCVSSFLPQAIASDTLRLRPTVFPAVPPLLKALVESDVSARSLASLRLVISAGSPLAPEVSRTFEAKFGIRVRGFYGTSETGGISFDRTGEATLSGRSVGTPLAGVRIALGKGGRFTVTSPAVLGKGRFSPADRASLNGARELTLLGRTGRMVKVAGRRLNLSEIEAALRSVPGIRDAYAHLGTGAASTLAAAAATELSPTEIRRLLRSRLASWKIPGRIIALGEFPTTPRGKTDGRKLRQVLSAPRTATSISTLSSQRQMSARR